LVSGAKWLPYEYAANAGSCVGHALETSETASFREALTFEALLKNRGRTLVLPFSHGAFFGPDPGYVLRRTNSIEIWEVLREQGRKQLLGR
jgi:hypothetical protein